jgi:hypothetical protein
MKHTYPFVLILMFLIACSNQSGSSDSNQDTTQMAAEDENGRASESAAVTPEAEAQSQLNNFLKDFNETKSQLNKFIYNDQVNEYDANTKTYYYQGKTLVYVLSEFSSEGGYLETLLIKVHPDYEVVLEAANNPSGQSAYAKEGYFSYKNNGEPVAFTINSGDNDSYLIKGVTEAKSFDYGNEIQGHLDSMREHKGEFTLSQESGMYEYYIERKKITSEYGEMELTRSYRVDKNLFENGPLFVGSN